MNKENTDKLLNIIDLLDKIAKNNESEHKHEDKKLGSYLSSEVMQTLESMKREKSIFPMNYQQKVSSRNSNFKLLRSMRSKKSIFYLNRSSLSENPSGYIINGSMNDEFSFFTSGRSSAYSKFYQMLEEKLTSHSNEGTNFKYLDKQDEQYEEEDDDTDSHGKLERKPKFQFGSNKESHSDVKDINTSSGNTDAFDKENGYYKSSMFQNFSMHNGNLRDMEESDAFKDDDGLMYIKMLSDTTIMPRKSKKPLKDYFSDTELLKYTKSEHNNKTFIELFKRSVKKKSKKVKASVKESPHLKRFKTRKLKPTIVDNMGSNEYLDQTIVGHLFEKIIEMLNVSLKENINSYLKKINKLTQANESLKDKLERAVENNDEQAQEIRDLNKRIKSMHEKEVELSKTIEKYEYEMNNAKIIEGKLQGDIQYFSALEVENKNLKKELNGTSAANESLKNEIIQLQDKINRKNEKLKEEGAKIKSLHEALEEKDTIIAHIQMMNHTEIPTKETKPKKTVESDKMKSVSIERCYSDTIIWNFERIKAKLFETNERCYFLSKCNLELFKGLRKKKKKINSLEEQILFLKESHMKTREKYNNIMFALSNLGEVNENLYSKLMEYDANLQHYKNLNIEELLKIVEEHELMIASNAQPKVEVKELEKLKDLLEVKTNEYNLLNQKFEQLFEKYLELLENNSCENNEVTFIEQIIPDSGIIHSFYVEAKDNIDVCNNKTDNVLVKYVKAHVVNKRIVDMKDYSDFKVNENYQDLEYYLNTQVLNNMDINNILDVRYIYSYGDRKKVSKSKKSCEGLNLFSCVKSMA